MYRYIVPLAFCVNPGIKFNGDQKWFSIFLDGVFKLIDGDKTASLVSYVLIIDYYYRPLDCYIYCWSSITTAIGPKNK